MADTFIMKRNDTGPVLEAQIQDASRTAVPLHGATVAFNMGTPDGTVLVNRAAVDIVDAETGVVRYAWRPGDTSEAGIHRGEFEVTFFDGRIETFPKARANTGNFITIVVTEDVA